MEFIDSHSKVFKHGLWNLSIRIPKFSGIDHGIYRFAFQSFQAWTMEFIDFSPSKMDNLDWKEKTNRNNSPILPRSIRGLIVGKSGCGKTNLLLNLLLKPELLDYNS